MAVVEMEKEKEKVYYRAAKLSTMDIVMIALFTAVFRVLVLILHETVTGIPLLSTFNYYAAVGFMALVGGRVLRKVGSMFLTISIGTIIVLTLEGEAWFWNLCVVTGMIGMEIAYSVIAGKYKRALVAAIVAGVVYVLIYELIKFPILATLYATYYPMWWVLTDSSTGMLGCLIGAVIGLKAGDQLSKVIAF